MKKTIRVTKNYDQFDTIKGNRKIDLKYLTKLVKSMAEEYIPVPIIVNSNFEVLDGQHRLEACKVNQLPLYFIISDDMDLESIRAINSVVKKWTLEDYLDSYKQLETKLAGPYTTIAWYKKHYNLNLETSIAILHNKGTMAGSQITEEFKKGRLVIEDLNWAKSFGNFLLKIKPYFSQYNKRAFVHALLHMDTDHRFSRKTFLQRMEVNSMKMRRCTNVIDYFELLEYIYNIGSKPKFQFDRKEQWNRAYKPLR